MEPNPTELYLDLLKKCLTRSIMQDSYEKIPRNTKTFWRTIRWLGYELVQRNLSRQGLSLVHSRRRAGETMIGMGALTHLEQCVADVLQRNVPGDFCETGIWRGGACIFMRE